MPRPKKGTIFPSVEENAAICAGMAADADNPELTAEWFENAKPAGEFFPPDTYASLKATWRPRGRPKVIEKKVSIAIRLDADILKAFRETGKGWQTRLNSALRRYISEHPLQDR